MPFQIHSPSRVGNRRPPMLCCPSLDSAGGKAVRIVPLPRTTTITIPIPTTRTQCREYGRFCDLPSPHLLSRPGNTILTSTLHPALSTTSAVISTISPTYIQAPVLSPAHLPHHLRMQLRSTMHRSTNSRSTS